ncbi:MAG TPA: selenium cofactor biosynthesis protein YqeC [Blastocatellia bacterium]|nr:selenium cofactor biosynthesis protein YqeC [Blastocatellia bacterium]
MLLCKALDLNSLEIISFCGGGGKTSTIQLLCKELSSRNRSVISTVTTRIGLDQIDGIEPILIGDIHEPSISQAQQIRNQINNKWALVAGQAEGTKLTGVDPNAVCALGKLADYVLVEADGSRGLPIKAPAEHEPVVPACTTTTVVLIGIDAIGRKILPNEVHRPERICQLTGKAPGDEVDAELVAKLVVDPQGLFKGAPDRARRFVLLNKVSRRELLTQAQNIAAAVRNLACTVPIIITDTRNTESPIYQVIS